MISYLSIKESICFTQCFRNTKYLIYHKIGKFLLSSILLSKSLVLIRKELKTALVFHYIAVFNSSVIPIIIILHFSECYLQSVELIVQKWTKRCINGRQYKSMGVALYSWLADLVLYGTPLSFLDGFSGRTISLINK